MRPLSQAKWKFFSSIVSSHNKLTLQNVAYDLLNIGKL